MEGSDEEDWDTDSGEDIEAEDATKCLFTDDYFPSVAAALEHDAHHSGFDLHAFIKQAKLDDYGAIRCINYIRAAVKAGRDPRPELAAALSGGAQPWDKDQFLFPVLQDDSLLCHEFGGPGAPAAEDSGRAAEEAAGPSGQPDGQPGELEHLRQENAALRAALQRAALPGVSDEDAQDMQEDLGMARLGLAGSSGGESGQKQPQQLHVRQREGAPHKTLRQLHIEQADEGYFDSYGYFDIHRTMISDKVRTDAYQAAIEGNPSLMRGATVLDVGTGTGILSLFAARAGAQRVLAVEGSKRMADFARKIVAENGMGAEAGGPITVLSGRIEDIDSLPVQQVDVIVSEWMGYALLFESMLDSVLHARDKWLRPGGALLPDFATMSIAAADASALDLDFWDDVAGLSFAPVRAALREAGQRAAHVAPVPPSSVLSAACPVRYLDLAAMRPEDVEFSADFTLHPTPTASGAPVEAAALVLWFYTEFSARFCAERPVALSTSPAGPQTHWAQTVLTLRAPVLLQAPTSAAGAPANGRAAAAMLKGRLSVARGERHRCLDISLECQPCDAAGAALGPTVAQLFSIATAGS